MNKDLKDLLNGLTKKDLDNIRRKLNIRGVSNLKKADLIDVLNDEISLNAENIINDNLNENLVGELKNVLQNGTNMSNELFEALKEFGLAFEEEEKIVPQDIKYKLSLSSQQKKVEKVTEEVNKEVIEEVTEDLDPCIQYAKELIKYYGVIEYKKLYSILSGYIRIDNSTCVNKLISYTEKSSDIKQENLLFYSTDVEDFHHVFSRQKMRQDIDFYIFKRDELFKDDLCKVYRNELKNFMIKEFNFDSKTAENKVKSLVMDIQNEKRFVNIVDEISQGFVFKDESLKNRFYEIIKDIHNNTRMWVLKGYTPNEIVLKIQQKMLDNKNIITKKVGRNDPCPCGSGKKYKKCCGR